MNKCLLSICAFLLLCASANAADWAAQRKNAENGDPMAQYQYGDELMWQGDKKEANSWYEKAASQGNIFAQISLAINKLSELQPDSPEEKAFLEKLCPGLKAKISDLEKSGDPEAAYNLGDIYGNGICVAQDVKKSRSLNQFAAARGHDRAQLREAKNCREDKNYPQMIEWYEKAMEFGMPKAAIELAGCHYSGLGVQKDIVKADKLVGEYGADATPYMQGVIGYLYLKGRDGFPKDEARARHWLEKAAAAGSGAAKKMLAKMNKTQ